MQNAFNVFWVLVRFGNERKILPRNLYGLRNVFWSLVQFSLWFFSVDESGVDKVKSFLRFLCLRLFIGLAPELHLLKILQSYVAFLPGFCKLFIQRLDLFARSCKLDLQLFYLFT